MNDYVCHHCSAEDCKLWRVAATTSISLICIECLREKGHVVDLESGDQVYSPEVDCRSYVPAVPDLRGNWWGYSSVPNWWVAWWKALPDSRTNCTMCNGNGRLGDTKSVCYSCKGGGQRT